MADFTRIDEIIYKREKGQGFLASAEYEKGLKRVNPDGFIEAFLKPEDIEAFNTFLREQKAHKIQADKDKSSYENTIFKFNNYIDQLKSEMADKNRQIEYLESRGAKLSKADGKKEQKRSLEDPDYKIDRIEINKKGYFYTYITPFTIKNLKISLKELEKTIERDLTKLLKGDNQYFRADIQKIYTFNDVFMVTIKTDKEIG